MNDDLPKGSVRSLPKGKLQEFKRLFNQAAESGSCDLLQEETKSSNVDDNQGMASPIRRWREPLKPPVTKHTEVTPGSGLLPTPSPRNSIKKGHAALTSENSSNLTPDISSTSDTTTAGQVSKVKDRFEQHLVVGAGNKDGERISAKVHLKPRNPSPRKQSPSPVREASPRRSPLLVRRQKEFEEVRDENTYSCIWKHDEKPTPPSQQDKPRPATVFEKSKLFENLSHSSSPPAKSQSKPEKPPPPARQRSISDATGSEINSAGKTRPPRPPFRQRSFIDRIVNKANESESKKEPLSNPVKKPPGPPSKPPRTGAHDDYVRVKLEKETVENRVNLECEQNGNKAQESQTNITEEKTREFLKKLKPLRPPPPRKKVPRPFSIATDSISDFSPLASDSSSDSDELARSLDNDDNPFYESLPTLEEVQDANVSLDSVKHWDLPRMLHPEPKTMRRSRSAECIQKAVDDEGNMVYMDPDNLHINDSSQPGYDIYVDVEGYAVPNRLVKRNAYDESENSRHIGDRFKSKMRRFKNLFTDQDKPSKPTSPVTRCSQKERLNKIRAKVDQAYEVLHDSFRKKDIEDVDTHDILEENLSNDSESRVDDHEIRKRVEYSRSVRIKTQQSIGPVYKLQRRIYPQMFEHAMIVGLHLNTESSIYEPYVIYKFPEIRNYKLTMEGKLYPCSESKDSNVSVPLFCFPDAANFKTTSSSRTKSQSYNFVLTNIDGGRVYGYCRRLVPPKSKIPEVICIISPVEAFSMYNELLKHIEEKRQESLDSAQELIAAAFGRPLPQPGQTETIRTLDEEGELETLFLTRDAENRFDNTNVECLLHLLGSDKLLKVFSTILLERSVLFSAKHLSTLSSTIHAIVSLLYPFSWQHTFIPVLPAAMVDVVCSPTPYVMGITAPLVSHVLTLPLDENVLVIDIDKRTFVRCQGDEGTLLPKKIEKALKTSLNMCRIDAEAKMSANLMISEAFLRFFVEAIGHYGQYIINQADGTRVFQKEQFIHGTKSSSMQQLLEWLVETQMFEVFMTRQLERKDDGHTIEEFQSLVHEQLGLKRRLGKKLS
ncbi:DENN domain-containing protein 2B-like isoform X2 [Mya arenaria]|uniref:DENN domain-containing protein 2B-like isoform X2 n=1 Tax=Mya arenaria TaxID=6604 RepID=UPI0022E67B57|nr:DENN domain-containing protein 2B-like isoform X2 [Mya arenaria]